jgi:hypothetical protein
MISTPKPDVCVDHAERDEHRLARCEDDVVEEQGDEDACVIKVLLDERLRLCEDADAPARDVVAVKVVASSLGLRVVRPLLGRSGCS